MNVTSANDYAGAFKRTRLRITVRQPTKTATGFNGKKWSLSHRLEMTNELQHISYELNVWA